MSEERESLALPPRRARKPVGDILGGALPPNSDSTPLVPTAPITPEQAMSEVAPVNYVPRQQPRRVAPKKPVTKSKVTWHVGLNTQQRLENVFAHLLFTGQVSRKSHLVDQAINEFCERIEEEQNGGAPFPQQPSFIAPTGRPAG